MNRNYGLTPLGPGLSLETQMGIKHNISKNLTHFGSKKRMTGTAGAKKPSTLTDAEMSNFTFGGGVAACLNGYEKPNFNKHLDQSNMQYDRIAADATQQRKTKGRIHTRTGSQAADILGFDGYYSSKNIDKRKHQSRSLSSSASTPALSLAQQRKNRSSHKKITNPHLRMQQGMQRAKKIKDPSLQRKHCHMVKGEHGRGCLCQLCNCGSHQCGKKEFKIVQGRYAPHLSSANNAAYHPYDAQRVYEQRVEDNKTYKELQNRRSDLKDFFSDVSRDYSSLTSKQMEYTAFDVAKHRREQLKPPTFHSGFEIGYRENDEGTGVEKIRRASVNRKSAIAVYKSNQTRSRAINANTKTNDKNSSSSSRSKNNNASKTSSAGKTKKMSRKEAAEAKRFKQYEPVLIEEVKRINRERGVSLSNASYLPHNEAIAKRMKEKKANAGADSEYKSRGLQTTLSLRFDGRTSDHTVGEDRTFGTQARTSYVARKVNSRDFQKNKERGNKMNYLSDLVKEMVEQDPSRPTPASSSQIEFQPYRREKVVSTIRNRPATPHITVADNRSFATTTNGMYVKHTQESCMAKRLMSEQNQIEKNMNPKFSKDGYTYEPALTKVNDQYHLQRPPTALLNTQQSNPSIREAKTRGEVREKRMKGNALMYLGLNGKIF